MSHLIRCRIIYLLLPFIILSACQSKKEKASDHLFSTLLDQQLKPELVIDPARIHHHILNCLKNSPKHSLIGQAMRHYYRNNANFLWLGKFRIEPQTDSLLMHLKKSTNHGLPPEYFHWSAIRNEFDKLNNLSFEKGDDINQLLARLEYNLTVAYLQYVCGLNFGFVNPHLILNRLEEEETTDPKSLDSLPKKALSKKELYSIVLKSCDGPFVEKALEIAKHRNVASFLQEMTPSDKWYIRLQSELKKMNALSEKSFPDIPYIGDTLLKPGDRSAIVTLIARRLKMTGELPLSESNLATDQLLTQELMDAINLFRKENGMGSTNFFGNLTIKALNRPVSYYTSRLRANLERLRWKPKQEKGERYVVVNVASSTLEAINVQADTILEMRVCVGSIKNKTPLLSSMLRYMEMNPYWNVPQSIIKKEIIPSYNKDTTYFTRNRFRIYDKEGKEVNPHSVDWSKYRGNVPFDIKQDNKDGNSLGRMIFRFPNNHAVYLHDTPAKYAFRLTNRAISHGCVRLENPMDFAFFLIGEADENTKDRIRLAIGLPASSEKNQKLKEMEGYKDLKFYSFKPPVALFVDYYTVSISKTGKLSYCGDPYGYDLPLLHALDATHTIPITHDLCTYSSKKK